MVGIGCEAVTAVVVDGVERAMAAFNQRVKETDGSAPTQTP
jgi:hypothetical protein